MGIKFLDILKRNKGLAELAIGSDGQEIDKLAQEIYLKRMALDICANFVARSVGQSKFIIDNPEWYYKLNIRPNTDSSSTQFWEQFVYKLIVDNRVLVIMSESDDMLIADDYTRNEYAVYEDSFEGVTVKGYTFSRTFRMNEVLYLEYNNKKLSEYTDGLFRDYAELYAKMVEAAGRNNQIRGTVSLDSGSKLDDETRDKIQDYIDKLFYAFKNKSVAIAPLVKGFKYEEYTGKSATGNINLDEINKIPQFLIDSVADAIGIPTALLHGNRAELKDNITAFNKYCLAYLLKKIEDELNAKIISKQDYINGKRVEVTGINRPDMFELAEAIDKLISSSAFNPNEIRKELGYEPREGGDEYVRTKNYEEAQKGGEEE